MKVRLILFKSLGQARSFLEDKEEIFLLNKARKDIGSGYSELIQWCVQHEKYWNDIADVARVYCDMYLEHVLSLLARGVSVERVVGLCSSSVACWIGGMLREKKYADVVSSQVCDDFVAMTVKDMDDDYIDALQAQINAGFVSDSRVLACVSIAFDIAYYRDYTSFVGLDVETRQAFSDGVEHVIRFLSLNVDDEDVCLLIAKIEKIYRDPLKRVDDAIFLPHMRLTYKDAQEFVVKVLRGNHDGYGDLVDFCMKAAVVWIDTYSFLPLKMFFDVYVTQINGYDDWDWENVGDIVFMLACCLDYGLDKGILHKFVSDI